MINIKKILSPVLNRVFPPLYKIYLKKERNYTYKNIKIKVFPGIFHPGIYFSTTKMLNFIDSLNLKNKTILEIGCGTGIISIYAAKKNAIVTAIDVNHKAVKNTIINSKINEVKINVIESNLFSNLYSSIFELIIINPPFFKKNPENSEDYAWNCGEKLEYFHELFASIGKYAASETEIYMILSEKAPISEILEISKDSGYKSKTVYQNTKFWEQFQIIKFSKNYP